MHLELLLRAGILATRTVGEPGAHGAAVTGTQGIGVSTPKAAAVAAATVGLAGELHMPNGVMFIIGLLSIILAIGIEVRTAFMGSTFKVPGAAPKLHWIIAPPQTRIPIVKPPFWSKKRTDDQLFRLGTRLCKNAHIIETINSIVLKNTQCGNKILNTS
jgi:hypothetical protein